MKRGLLLIVAGLAIFFSFWGIAWLGASKQPGVNEVPKKPKPLVRTEVANIGSISNSIELTGSVEPIRIAKLASPAEGPVVNCSVREGDQVRAGQKILSIGRKKAADALLKSAKQDVETEKEELGRIEKLVETGAIPRDQLDNAKAKYARTLAQLEKVRENSEDYDIEAPWDGVVSKVLVNDGNYVAARTVLVEIFDPKSLVVRMAVPESVSQEISSEMDVNVKLDAHHGQSFAGRVSRMYPELDRRLRTRLVEVSLLKDVPLTPGMFARLEMTVKSGSENVVVPSEAVIVTPKGIRVAYVVEDCKARQRKVETGIEAEGKVQILSGLKPDEQIIVAGNEKLKDGVEIRTAVTPKKEGDTLNDKSNPCQ
ncbi:MAG: efflux RND transporter periplasmic adaptor subunit [Desulfomonilaceae bacterium]